jgi:WD40 repeat protein
MEPLSSVCSTRISDQLRVLLYISGDVETKQNTTTFTVGGDVASQQNGNIWASENDIVSLSLNGTLNVFDPRDNSTWRKIHASRYGRQKAYLLTVTQIQGPTKAVTASTLATKPEPTFFTGSFDGSVRAFDLPSGEAHAVEDQSGEGQISGMSADSSTGEVWASTWTDGQGLVRLDKKAFR